MTVDIEAARAKNLVQTHEGREYVFCGKGCFLEFADDLGASWRWASRRRCSELAPRMSHVGTALN
jgi:hypothetical protein